VDLQLSRFGAIMVLLEARYYKPAPIAIGIYNLDLVQINLSASYISEPALKFALIKQDFSCFI
jgi:hypothetical protein